MQVVRAHERNNESEPMRRTMIGTPVKPMMTMMRMACKVAVLTMRGVALNLIPHSDVLKTATFVDLGIIRTSTDAGLEAGH